MALAFNEEQRSLKDTAKGFAKDKAPIEAFRTVRQQLNDGTNPMGYDLTLWQEMVELGWAGMPFPEKYGGYEFGFMGLAACMEELGHTLTASPLLSNVILSGATILFAGSEQQKETLLAQIVAGEVTYALAIDEDHHHNPSCVKTTATQTGDAYTLSGNKTFVVDGHSADQLIVSARSSGGNNDTQGISLFLVDAKVSGLNIERVNLLDSRGYAKITLDNVTATLLGEQDQGFASLDKALDVGRVCLAAEMLGGIEEIFDRTVEYLKERKQFGELIGSFQSLQHRSAHMYTQIEMCRSALMNALSSIENETQDNNGDFAALASAAKAILSETYELVSNEAVQMHGGIGVTDELDIGLFLKRARVSAALLGNASFHYQRYASVNNY